MIETLVDHVAADAHAGHHGGDQRVHGLDRDDDGRRGDRAAGGEGEQDGGGEGLDGAMHGADAPGSPMETLYSYVTV